LILQKFPELGLAYYPDNHQRSSKHTRTFSDTTAMDPQLRKNRETTHGPITERSGIRMERTL